MKNVQWSGGTAREWLWASEEMRWRRIYQGRKDQVAQARKFTEALFAGAPCGEVAALAVSELATNAIRHSRSGEGEDGWFGLEVVYDNPVYLAVTDMGGHGIPTPLPEGYAAPGKDLEESGRGLRMLSELALTFGVHGSSVFGHTVWVDLDLNRSLEDENAQSPAALVS
ncbi:ATP-binding protein [Spirillospora sp. NPDC127200]